MAVDAEQKAGPSGAAEGPSCVPFVCFVLVYKVTYLARSQIGVCHSIASYVCARHAHRRGKGLA